MPLSMFYILDLHGKIILFRDYRGDVTTDIIEEFIPALVENEEEKGTIPILRVQDCNFAFIKQNNLYFVCVVKKNANLTMIFTFLYKLFEVLSAYMTRIEDESIEDNLIVIYELLDEMMDFGYPQTTDTSILKRYITSKQQRKTKEVKLPPAVTNAVSWRPEGIRYIQNKVTLEVIESINFLSNKNGTVLVNEILGTLKMTVQLSGMPELRLGINDTLPFANTGLKDENCIEIEDVKLHQCVKLSRFKMDRTVSFVPPDGQFEVMSYRVNLPPHRPLILVNCNTRKYSETRMEYNIKAQFKYSRAATATKMEIHIPVPSDATSPKFKAPIGKVLYDPGQNMFIWIIKSVPGGKEYIMNASFSMPSVKAVDSEVKPPIRVKFCIPYFMTSGIHVKYLRIVEDTGYNCVTSVTYTTQSGDYEIRTN